MTFSPSLLIVIPVVVMVLAYMVLPGHISDSKARWLPLATILSIVVAAALGRLLPTYYTVSGTSPDDIGRGLAVNADLLDEIGGIYLYNKSGQPLYVVRSIYGRDRMIDRSTMRVAEPGKKLRLPDHVTGWFGLFAEPKSDVKKSEAIWQVLTEDQL